MRSVLVYTLARLALFAATAGVLFLAGARGFLLLALAVLISGIVSFVLLSRQRDAVSMSVTERAARMRENLAEGAAREDDQAAEADKAGEGDKGDKGDKAGEEKGSASARTPDAEGDGRESVAGSRSPAPHGDSAA
jgi:uncharacterized membrane protein YgaE (UPF0421/DUF939 family)